MPNTPEEFLAYCRSHPTDTVGPGKSWDQKCVSLVFRAGGFTDSRDSAYRAALATAANGHRLDTTTPLDDLPSGWFVYFDKAGPDNGHIGMTTGHGGFISANWRVSDFGTALGVMRIADYIATGAIYMGASPYFINSTLDLSSTSGLTPIGLPDMAFDAEELHTLDLVGQSIKDYTNGMGQSLKEEFTALISAVGPKVWETLLVHKSGVVGAAGDWTMNTSDAVASLAQKTGQVEGLILALKQVAGGGTVDLAAITAASEKGAAAALAKLTVTIAAK